MVHNDADDAIMTRYSDSLAQQDPNNLLLLLLFGLLSLPQVCICHHGQAGLLHVTTLSCHSDSGAVTGHSDSGAVPGHSDSGAVPGHSDSGAVPGHCDTKAT